jgi:predicted exporter
LTQRNLSLLAWLWGLMVCFLLAHNGYLWWNNRIAPETDILALLPLQERDGVLRQALTHMVDKGQQRLFVLVGADEWAQARDAADAYHLALASHADLLHLEQRSTADSQHEWLGLFKQHRVGLLTPQQESALHQLPAQFWVDQALSKLYRPFGGSMLSVWQDDPFDLFSGWAQARAQETAVRLREGRLFVSDGQRQYVVMPFTVSVPAFSIAAQQAIIPILEKAKQRARQVVPSVEVLSVGVILYAAAAAEQATLEVTTIGLGSMLGIIVLTWMAFRSFQPIALVIISVGIGCLGALSVCWVVFDRIHLLTLVFGASLIGGAQDYGTYFFCNRLAADVQEFDSWQLLRRLMPALILALVTTVIGYLGLALTPIPGLQQVAIFSAVGLVFAWLTVICWFPILARRGSLKGRCVAERSAGIIERWPLLQFNRSTLAVGLVAIAFAALGLSRLAPQDDLRSLQNPPKHLFDEQIKVSRLLDAPAPAQFYLVRGATAEAVLLREETLRARLDRLIDRRLISGYQAVSSWVPSFSAQAGRVQLIQQKLLNEGGPLNRVAEQIGEDGKWVTRFRERLLESALPLTPEQFLAAPISAPGRYLWLGNVEGTYGNIVALRGASKDSLPILRQAATGLDGVQWVDKVGEVSSVLGAYRQYMSWVVVVSYFAVYGLLYPRYRRATWRVLAPTALASIVTLALLGSVGAGLQLFHVLALMLLLGIGVDYGIFLQEHSGGRDAVAWLSVALSAINTLLSFGLLSLSKTPALQAFGLTMLIGTVTVCLAVPYFRVKAAQQNAEFEAKRLAVTG